MGLQCLQPAFVDSSGKLFLGNVPAEATEEDLRGIFCDVDGLKEVPGLRLQDLLLSGLECSV